MGISRAPPQSVPSLALQASIVATREPESLAKVKKRHGARETSPRGQTFKEACRAATFPNRRARVLLVSPRKKYIMGAAAEPGVALPNWDALRAIAFHLSGRYGTAAACGRGQGGWLTPG